MRFDNFITSPQDISNDKKVFTKLFTITYRIERNEYCKKLRLLKVYMSTWSYENRVSKHFVIFLNFPSV